MVVAYEVFESETSTFVADPCGMAGCSEEQRVICRCLQVTETKLSEAHARCRFECLRDIAVATGAGTGCTACHRHLRKFIRP
jgi:bacterioferritin-associated ferredoxin